MTVIHAGALLDRAPGRKYAAALSFAELAPAEPLPKPSTIKRWRADLPEAFDLAFVVPGAARRSAKGSFRNDDAMDASLAWTRDVIAALEPKFVVVPTGADFTTGQRDRDAMASWLDRLGDRRTIVWHPSGLWEAEQAVPFAQKLGMLWAFDPLEHDPPPGPQIYARMRALGVRTRLTETLLLDALDRILEAEAEEAWVAIESPRSFREASRLAELAASEE